jgi:hypothetical protein
MGLTARRRWIRFVAVSLAVVAVWALFGYRVHKFWTFALTGLCTQIVFFGLDYSKFQGEKLAEQNINKIRDRD